MQTYELFLKPWYACTVWSDLWSRNCHIRLEKVDAISGQNNHTRPQPPSLNPPLSVVVIAAVLQISSNTSWTSSPVKAEHSIYLSHLISCAILYASWGYIVPFGSFSDLRSRLRPKMRMGMSFLTAKCFCASLIHCKSSYTRSEGENWRRLGTNGKACRSLHVDQTKSIADIIA